MEAAEPFVRCYEKEFFPTQIHNNVGMELFLLRVSISLLVRNCTYNKKLILTFSVLREDGAIERYISDAKFSAKYDSDWEVWNCDKLPLFPYDSPHGKLNYCYFSYILHYDGHPFCSEKEYYVCSIDDWENDNFYPIGQTFNQPFSFSPDLLSDATYSVYGRHLDLDVRFTREPLESQEHPIALIHSLLDRVADNARSDPYNSHYVHLSIFNFDNENIVNHLIYLHNLGVDVECIAGWEQISSMDWQESMANLRRAGIPLYGVVRNTPADPTGGIASMHTKFIVFDRFAAMSSSYNLDFQNWSENRENGIFYFEPKIALLYENIFQVIKGAPFLPYHQEISGNYNLYYSFGTYISNGQNFSWRELLAHELSMAHSSILVAMFDLSDFELSNGTLFEHLISAADRGVAIHLVLNGFKCGGYDSQFFYRAIYQPLLDHGIQLYLVFNQYNDYSPLHHKFAIIDESTVIAESLNWYPASIFSDELFSVIRDPQLASKYMDELIQILERYRVASF